MKKSISVIFIVALMAINSQLLAQEYTSSILFGVKGGLVISDFDFDNDFANDLFETRTGFTGGLFIQYYINGWLITQPELNYTTKGTRSEIMFSDESGSIIGIGEMEYILDYIEVPIIMVFTVPGDYPVKPKVALGPQIGFNVRSKEELSGMVKVGSAFTDLDANEVVFDLVIGTGLDIRLGKTTIVTDFRYDLGLSNTGILGENKSRTFSFQLGVAFHL
jgi:hypothetical protein